MIRPQASGGFCSQKTKACFVFFAVNIKLWTPRTMLQYSALHPAKDTGKRPAENILQPKYIKLLWKLKWIKGCQCFITEQYEEKEAVRNDVLYNAFAALYWLAREAVANVKLFSLLNLFRAVGLDKMQHFNHKSPAAVGEMFLTSGNVVKNMIIHEIIDWWSNWWSNRHLCYWAINRVRAVLKQHFWWHRLSFLVQMISLLNLSLQMQKP